MNRMAMFNVFEKNIIQCYLFLFQESEFKKYSFYPGQQLWGPTFCFHKVKWLNQTKAISDIMECPNKSVRVVVEDVRMVFYMLLYFFSMKYLVTIVYLKSRKRE